MKMCRIKKIISGFVVMALLMQSLPVYALEEEQYIPVEADPEPETGEDSFGEADPGREAGEDSFGEADPGREAGEDSLGEADPEPEAGEDSYEERDPEPEAGESSLKEADLCREADRDSAAGYFDDGWMSDGLKAPDVDEFLSGRKGYSLSVSADLAGDTYYNSMDLGYITPVRDQADSNLCWAFSASAAMEANAAKNGHTMGRTYYSPDALGYYFFNRVTDPLALTEGVQVRRTRSGKKNYYDNGGNIFNTVFELMQWMGPVSESAAPFTGEPNEYPETVDYAYGMDEVHLQSAVWTASSSRLAIKQMVREYGAAAISLAMDGAKSVSYNGAVVKTLYNDSRLEPNHAVAIVGWDDSIPPEAFRGARVSSERPSESGAWICKNSYSEDGIFYLSYEDSSISEGSKYNKAIAYQVEAAGNYDHNYGYDGGIGTNRAGRTGVIYGASVYKAAANGSESGAESISAVSFGTNTAGVTYDISIYTGVNYGSKNPVSGVLMEEKKADIPLAYPGFYTVKLDEPVYVDEGDYFSVVVKLTAPAASSPVNLMYDDLYGGSTWVYSNPNAEGYRSFMSKNGEDWDDTATDNLNSYYDQEGSHNPSEGYVRIRAYTDDTEVRGQIAIESDMVALTPGQIYTGEQITPDPQVYYGATRLKKDRDYTVSYGANKTVGKGTGTLTVRGNGRYITKTAIVRTFDIKKRSIADPGIEIFGLEDLTYTGQDLRPVSLSFNGMPLREDHDYVIKYRKNNSVGTVTAQIRGKGSFTGARKVSFNVEKRDIADENITVKPIKDMDYKGVLLTPQITVINGYDHKAVLKEGQDYTLEYYDNLAPGTARVLILGKGSYSGFRYVSFNINGADLSKATMSKISDCTYTGDAIAPEVEVYYGSKKLTESVDYEITYANNINVGTAVISIAGRKGTIYAGTGLTKTFNIKPAAISNATLENFGDVAYKTGVRYYTQNESQTGTNGLKLRLPGGNYASPSEYVISYENNYCTGSNTTAVMTIKATGENLTGSLSKTFNILSGADVVLSDYTDSRIKVTGFSSSREYIYDASDHRENADNSVKPAVTVSYKGQTLKEGEDYILTYHDNNAIGRAYLTIEAVSGSGYVGSRTEYFEIIGKPIFVTALGVADNDFYSVGPEDCVYNGAPQRPEILVYERILKDKKDKDDKKQGVKRLVEGRDYTLKYSRNVDAGEARAVLTGIGEYSGSYTFGFHIFPADISKVDHTFVWPVSYTGQQICPQLYLTNAGGYLMDGVDYELTYGENINAGKGTITFTAKDLPPEDLKAGLEPNYIGQLTVPFTIKPRALSDGCIRVAGIDGIRYSGERVVPDMSLILNCGFGDIVVPESEYNVTYASNETAGTGRFMAKARSAGDGGTGNFTGMRRGTFNIAGITLNDISGYEAVYTGRKASLTIPVIRTETGVLVDRQDYTIKTDKRKDAGDGVFTITGKGGYKGSVAYGSYRILPKEIASDQITFKNIKSGVYTSPANPVRQQSTMKVMAGGKRLVKGRDYVITYYNNRAPGMATMVVALVNNYSGSASVQFEIN